MNYQRPVRSIWFCLVLISLAFISACSSSYGNDDFSFSAPFGFKTKEYESQTDSNRNAEYLLFSHKGHLYFQISRQEIPQDSDLDTVFAASVSKPSDAASHFQFISQNTIEVNDQQAIEYVYREFRGEPYVQIRELWMEHNGLAYTLFCSDPADSTPGLVIPVAEQCYELVEGFKFK